MEERTDLIAQAQALSELEERDRSFPLYGYRPIPKLAPFHLSRSRVRIVSGGNRSSKTHSGTAELAAYLLGYRPWILREQGLPIPKDPWIRPATLPAEAICFNLAGVRVQVPNTCFIVTGQSMKKGIGETIAPKLRQLLGPMISGEHMSHGGVPADYELKNGSRAVFGSAEQGNLAFESTNYTASYLDEPCPRRVYVGVSRGSIDQFAPLWLTFTPLGPYAAWIFRELYANTNLSKRQCETFNVSIFDNPYLPKEAVEEWANDPTINEAEKEARLYGRFMHLSDRIWSTFNEEVHIIAPFSPPFDGIHGLVVDPHTIKPWAMAWFWISPTGDIYFHKEWPTVEYTKARRSSFSIADYASLIKKIEGPYDISARLMDPNYGPRSDHIRGRYIPSVRDDIARYHLHFETSLNDDIVYGESRVTALLAYEDDKPIDSLNHPRIYFTEDCKNLINAMLFYTARPKQGQEELDPSKRDETYKDFADLVRYVAVSAFGQVGGYSSFDDSQFDAEAEEAFEGYGE